MYGSAGASPSRLFRLHRKDPFLIPNTCEEALAQAACSRQTICMKIKYTAIGFALGAALALGGFALAPQAAQAEPAENVVAAGQHRYLVGVSGMT